MKALLFTVCPLCHEKVQIWTEISEIDFMDLSCPTRVSIGNMNLAHFSRLLYHLRSTLEASATYQFVVPPFELDWTENNKMLCIYQYYGNDRRYWKVVEPVEFEEAVHWAKRLENLKVFS